MPTTPILKQAPLIHVVAQLHFSPLPQLEHEVHETLHRRLIEVGFPERVEASLEEVELSLDTAAGHEPRHASRRIPRLVFKGAGERSLVELRDDRLMLKTTDYHGHEHFLAQWFEVLAILAQVIPGFQQVLLHRMSLRYVDLIVPKPDETLQGLVTSSLLPPALPDLEASPLFGSTVKVVRTGEGRHLRVMFEEILSQEQRLTKVLPDDLAEHDRRCGLSIKGQPHWGEVIGDGYGLLDIEHVHTASDKPALGAVDKAEIFRQLHEKTSRAFWGVITEPAVRSWS
ncbi:MAG: TIGR04255 family protein [Pseudomonadota bacterium]